MSARVSPPFLRAGLGVILAAVTGACSPAWLAPSHGRVAITVRWPQRAASFRVLAIPEGTARIRVSIRGEGIAEGKPLEATLTPGGEEQSTQFLDVPVGPKYVEATSYDAADVATANGRQAIAVLPNVLVEARLVLEPIAAQAVASSPAATEPAASDALVVPATSPTPLEPARVIDTVAGDGVEGAVDSRDPLAARFKQPRRLLCDPVRQALFVADTGHRLIRRIDLQTGAVTTLAGRPESASGPASGVPPALAGGEPGVPSGLAVGPDGSLYFCDRDNHMVRMITPTGLVANVAGTGHMGYSDGAAPTAQFAFPSDLAVDGQGVLYVADTHNNRIRKIERGQVSTLAGTGTSLAAEAKGLKLPAAALALPVAIALDPAGTGLFIAEGKAHRVSRLAFDTKTLQPVAGSGLLGLSGENGPALAADLSLPIALAIDPTGALLIADGWAFETGVETLTGAASRVLRLNADGRLVRVAGSTRGGAYGYGGDGGEPTAARLNNPSGLALDAAGRLFIADAYNHRIRVVRSVPLVTPSASPSPSIAGPSPAPSESPRGTGGSSPTVPTPNPVRTQTPER